MRWGTAYRVGAILEFNSKPLSSRCLPFEVEVVTACHGSKQGGAGRYEGFVFVGLIFFLLFQPIDDFW